jgi:hypothetical protein
MEGYDYQLYGFNDYLEYAKNRLAREDPLLLKSAEDTLSGAGQSADTIYLDGYMAFDQRSADTYSDYGNTDCKVVLIATRL